MVLKLHDVFSLNQLRNYLLIERDPLDVGQRKWRLCCEVRNLPQRFGGVKRRIRFVEEKVGGLVERRRNLMEREEEGRRERGMGNSSVDVDGW